MKIEDQKLQYDINREVAKKSTLSSSKIDKNEYLTGEEILLFIQKQQNKLNFLIFLWEKLLKNKQKQLKIKVKNNVIR